MGYGIAGRTRLRIISWGWVYQLMNGAVDGDGEGRCAVKGVVEYSQGDRRVADAMIKFGRPRDWIRIRTLRWLTGQEKPWECGLVEE